MSSSSIVKITGVVVVILVVIGVGYFFFTKKKASVQYVAPVVETQVDTNPKIETVGTSVQNRAIKAYTYGNGTTSLLFVGGIHGGYEWNSVLLAYMFMDYLASHPEIIAKNLSITIIPTANPDGVFKVTGKEGRFDMKDVSTDKTLLAAARFNTHEVDLNRNFDCKWQPKSTWQKNVVSAGERAFSEPEAKAIQSFVLKHKPTAVVFWHSQAGAVYASKCEKGILAGTVTLMDTYAKASGYKAVKTFDAYETTGASEDWLASINIPAVTVELTNHSDIEWEKNLSGIKAVIGYYGR